MGRRHDITHPVTVTALAVVMPLSPVDLEDDPISEHEVDTSDARNLDLGSQPQPQALQAQSEK